MKQVHSVAVAVSALLLLAPSPAGAGPHGPAAAHFTGHGHGITGHHHSFSGRPHMRHSPGNGAYGAFYGGGIVAATPDDSGSVVNDVELPTVIYVALPPQALSCHRSREIVSVPAEAGGTKAITITRC
jgi:hypothetical protein